ncbi:MAG TPA: hypothetical protein VNI02_21835, partial [Blastocatellia bacterium]|nr:hypothetical protein [Blastocatellia bacterium]
MKTLSCFVIMPFADAKDDPVKLVRDDKRGLAVLPTGCQAMLPGGGPDPDNKPIPLDFNFVYDKIISRSIKDFNEKHAKKIEIKWNRAQDIQQGGAINDQVINKICTADITITDITTLNPNVFLEHGIRLAIKDSLNLMICHRGLKIPFDVSAERCIFYSKDV